MQVKLLIGDQRILWVDGTKYSRNRRDQALMSTLGGYAERVCPVSALLYITKAY